LLPKAEGKILRIVAIIFLAMFSKGVQIVKLGNIWLLTAELLPNKVSFENNMYVKHWSQLQNNMFLIFGGNIFTT
jgi:hypothetical protein